MHLQVDAGQLPELMSIAIWVTHSLTRNQAGCRSAMAPLIGLDALITFRPAAFQRSLDMYVVFSFNASSIAILPSSATTSDCDIAQAMDN